MVVGAAAADLLRWRQVGKIRAVALTGMDHQAAGGAPSRQQGRVGFDRPAQMRDVVAEHFAKTTWLEEVTLHVDDQQCRRTQIQAVFVGFCLHQHARPRWIINARP